MQRSDRELLKGLLAPIINRWGRREVLRVISELDNADQEYRERDYSNFLDRKSGEKKAQTLKPSAVNITEKMDIPIEKRELLINIASQFDHKSFLPTIPDIKKFS